MGPLYFAGVKFRSVKKMRKQTTSSSMDVPNRPVKKWKSGNIEAAVWSNKRDLETGEEVEFKTVSLNRSYKKKGEDLWRNDVIHLRRNDIQKVILVLNKAQEELLLTNSSGDKDD